jgi:hypothetical protein
MKGQGFRRPRLVIAICAGVTAVSCLAIVWGALEMMRTGDDGGLPGTAVGLGIAPAVLGLGMLFLAIRGARTVAAAQRGDRVFARWTVSSDELAAFAVNDKARNALGIAYGNDWKPPRKVPAEGIEIRFDPDGVLVGDTYFGLVTTGMFKFEGVQILPENPLAIEFGTVATTFSSATTVHVHTHRGVLRLPVGRLGRDEAVKVLDHYKRVDRRETIVNPGFYRGRIKFGLIAAAVCFVTAALGFAMEALEIGGDFMPVLLAVGGIVAGIGGLVLALLAKALSSAQHRPRA